MRTLPLPTSLRAALITAAFACSVLASPGLAQTPSRPVRLVIPFAAGGGTDPIARAVADKLASRLRQPVFVENRGGSGGTLGTDAVAKAAPDGYTLLFASTSITTNVASGKPLPYDLAKDLQPVGQVGASPLLFAVASSHPATSLIDLLRVARSKPRAVNYGSGGVGAISHLGPELLAREARVQFLHVPYRGLSPAITDLLGGSIQMVLCSPATAVPFRSAGRLRVLAVTSAERSPFMSEVPTVSESGVPGFQLEFWWGLMAPAGTPPAVIKRLNAELNWALAQPDVRALLARESAVPRPGTPEEFGRLIASEIARWKKLVKDANIQME